MQTMAQPQSSHQIKSENILYSALFFNILFTVMNTSMFNVAIPAVANQFSLANATSSWLVTCYSLFFAIGTVMYGRLSDFYPIKNLVTVGLCLLGIGSIIGMNANHFSTLLIARLIQAAGASSIPGLAMVMTSKYVPINRRGAAMGKISAGATLGFGLGPLVGGLITEYLGWSFLFFITLFAVISIPIYRAQLPIEQTKKGSFDFIGLLLLCSGVISLILFITTYQFIFLSGIIFLLLFWFHIQRIPYPFIPVHLLKKKIYVCMILLSFLVFFMNFAIIFVSPLLLANLFDKSAAQIGLIIFPGAIGSACASIYIGRIIDRKGPLIVTGAGIGFMALATFLLSSFTYISEWMILVFYLIASLGFSSISTSIPNYISRILSDEDIGIGLGSLQLIQFFGGAFGVSVSGAMLDSAVMNRLAYNFFWHNGNAAYSNTYLMLLLISIACGLIFFIMKRLIGNKLSQ